MIFADFCWFLLIFDDFFLWFLMIFDDFFMIFDELWWFLLIFHHLNLHFGQAKAKSSWWLQIYHGDRWRCRWTWWTSKWWKWSRFCCGPCLRNPSSCRPGRAGWENGGKMDGKMESVSIQVETTSRWSRPRSTLVTMPHHARWRVWRISPATNENFCSWKRRSSFCRSTKIFDLTLSSLWLFLSSFCCSSSSLFPHFLPFFAIFDLAQNLHHLSPSSTHPSGWQRAPVTKPASWAITTWCPRSALRGVAAANYRRWTRRSGWWNTWVSPPGSTMVTSG